MMRKFWLSGSLDIEKVTTREVMEKSDDYVGSGIVNDAFAEDEFDMSYARWKSLDVIKELEENISGNNDKDEIKKTGESQDSGHDSSSKNYSVTDSEETSTDTYSEITDVVDPLRRPTRSVSRISMIQKLTDEKDKLGSKCEEEECPYNKWLYRGHQFPENKTVADWELQDNNKQKEEKFPLENFSLPRVILSKHSEQRAASTSSIQSFQKSHRSSNSFHYSKPDYPFAFPSSTSSVYLPTFNPPESSGPHSPSTAPLPQYSPWNMYNNSSSPSIHSMTSPYPIVTLPRSARKNSKASQRSSSISRTYLTTLYKKTAKPKTPPAPIFYMKPRFSSNSSSSSSSCSCTSSTCSSCSSCIDIPTDSRIPFSQPSSRTRRKRHACLPRCDVTCCVIISFILASLLGLATLVLYLYLFTPVMDETGVV